MEDSILKDIKQKIGPSADYDVFNVDIIDAINTAFATLTQIGAGPSTGFQVVDETANWTDFTSNPIVLGLVKTYVYNEARLIFDPPSSSYVATAMKEKDEEYLWRISIEVDNQKGGI